MEKLSEKQILAVKSIEKPTLVVAVPGAGKTRVIVEKFIYLYSSGFDPSRMAAITFTNKAANEMKDRIQRATDGSINLQYISTIHSFALSIMMRNQKYFGGKSGITILDEDDSLVLIKNLISSNDRFNKLINEVKLISLIIQKAKEDFDLPVLLQAYRNAHHVFLDNSSLDDEIKKLNISIARHKIFFEKPLYLEFFKYYQQYLNLNNLMDFADLVLYPTLTMLYDNFARTVIQSSLQYILVDEYQDVDRMQNKFITLISNGTNITCVGDEDQSIYSFRGGTPENILNFENNFEDPVVLYLDDNYRSARSIIQVSNLMIKENYQRRNKAAVAVRNEKGVVDFIQTYTNSEQADFIVSMIKSLISKNGYSFKDFAILARASWLLHEIEEKLKINNIPYNPLRGTGFYQRIEVKYPLYYLGYCLNPENEFLLKKIINFPARGIGEVTFQEIISKKSSENSSLWEVLTNSNNNRVKAFVDIIVKLKNAKALVEFFTMLYDIVFKSKWETQIERTSENDYDEEQYIEPEELERKTNYLTLLELCKQADEKYSKPFEQFYLTIISYVEQPHFNDAVSIGTLHSAKGLEFPVVFLPFLCEELIPYTWRGKKADIEEERRLLYVGITRAKDQLYLLYPESLNGIILEKTQFLDFLEERIFCGGQNLQTKTRKDKINIGDFVEIKGYGKGIVKEKRRLQNGKFLYAINIEGDMIEVIQDYYEIKKIEKNEKKIIKKNLIEKESIERISLDKEFKDKDPVDKDFVENNLINNDSMEKNQGKAILTDDMLKTFSQGNLENDNIKKILNIGEKKKKK
ncbi:MAG TPA: ATP-dependent helicase [Exilispira sp.]|nr:ATP-dependent helicase [Exilispira sp.]